MIHLGKYNTLRFARMTAQGAYLEDAEGQQVLLPNKYVPNEAQLDASIEVFIHKDNDGRPVATTKRCKLTANSCAMLEVTNVVPNIGAFADIGLDKELLIPYNEQPKRLKIGEHYLVFMYVDEVTDRLVGSTNLHRHLSNEGTDFREGDRVKLIAWYPSELGWNMVVNKRHHGLIHTSDVFMPLEQGTKTVGYIRSVRPDGKLDLITQRPGIDAIEPNAQSILQELRGSGGTLPYNDKSDPAEIAATFKMSKKAFKKAIGGLYKQRLITITDEGITTV